MLICVRVCELPRNHVHYLDCMASCFGNIQAVMYTAVYTVTSLYLKKYENIFHLVNQGRSH